MEFNFPLIYPQNISKICESGLEVKKVTIVECRDWSNGEVFRCAQDEVHCVITLRGHVNVWTMSGETAWQHPTSGWDDRITVKWKRLGSILS